MKRKLVLTLSGGMDSSVLLYMAQDRGYEEIHTLTFDYGQRHKRELTCVNKQINNFEKWSKEKTPWSKMGGVQRKR